MDGKFSLESALQLLCQYVELAQGKGAYLLHEADLLKRAVDVIQQKKEDKEIDVGTATNLLIQAVNKGQRHGSYTLADASLLHRVVLFFQNPQRPEVVDVKKVVQNERPEKKDEEVLHELSEPVPLMAREI